MVIAYTPLSLAAQEWDISIAKFKDGKRAAISLTFDDGLAEHYTIVAPELEKRGMRGTFGVCGSNINADDEHIVKSDRMTWAQLRDMTQRGHEISNHGWAHRNHGRTPIDEVRQDIERNDSAIEHNVGIRPMTFFYPNNTKTKEGVVVAERGRIGTRLFQRSVGSKWTETQLEKWVDGGIDTCGWMVTMTHGITYGYDAFKDASRLTTFLDYLRSRSKDLWIARLQDALAYEKERKDIKLNVNTEGYLLTVVPTMTLDKNLFQQPLTLVVTGRRIKKATAQQDGNRLAVTVDANGRALLNFNPSGGAITIEVH